MKSEGSDMTRPTINLDGPILETIYNLITVQGTIIATFTDRDVAQAEANKRGLRMVKTIKEVE